MSKMFLVLYLSFVGVVYSTEVCFSDGDWLLHPTRICYPNDIQIENTSQNSLLTEIDDLTQKDINGFGTWDYKKLIPVTENEIIGFGIIFTTCTLFFINDSLNFGYLIGNIITLLMFNFEEVRTVGYANLITFLIFTILFAINMNQKRPYRDTLAVDYVLVTVLLPFQIIGRLIGTSINGLMPFYFSVCITCSVLLYLTIRLFIKGTAEWKNESIDIANTNSNQFISMNIIKKADTKNKLAYESQSCSSFSVESDKEIMVNHFEIEEASREEDSSIKDTLKIPNGNNKRSRLIDDQLDLYSDNSLIN